MLEFDLRKGLADPQGQDYMLMNSNAVTLVNLSESGEIEGDVSVQQYQACESDSLGGPFSHAVYLYPGDIGQSQMGDMGATDPALVEPIAIADVSSSEDDSGDTEYDYEFGFIGPGTYSLDIPARPTWINRILRKRTPMASRYLPPMVRSS